MSPLRRFYHRDLGYVVAPGARLFVTRLYVDGEHSPEFLICHPVQEGGIAAKEPLLAVQDQDAMMAIRRKAAEFDPFPDKATVQHHFSTSSCHPPTPLSLRQKI